MGQGSSTTITPIYKKKGGKIVKDTNLNDFIDSYTKFSDKIDNGTIDYKKLESEYIQRIKDFRHLISNIKKDIQKKGKATQKQLARGTRLREVLKQPQNSPLSVAEQVALIYTGINGYLDELAVSDVKNYCASLLKFLATSQKPYIGIVSSTNQFTEEAEASLLEAISESKTIFINK